MKSHLHKNCISTIVFCLFFSLIYSQNKKSEIGQTGSNKNILPKPFATPSAVNHSNVTGWVKGKKPVAPSGFRVNKFAEGFQNPRWIYVSPNGDLFISESSTKPNSANQITILQDSDKDGTYDTRETFLSNQNKPFGMLVLGNFFYVANTDALMRYPYQADQKFITETGTKIMNLPAGGYNNHWTRNIIASPDGKKF